MKNGYTDITLLLDRSGSMHSLWSDVEGGLNKFVEDNRNIPGEVKFTLLVFDENYGLDLKTVINAQDIRSFEKISLKEFGPRGGTPLYDAMGTTINRLGNRLAALPESERPKKVLFVTYTDGMENASREFKNGVKHMVEHQTNKYSWEFVYLGTNQDVHKVGSSLGIPVNNRMFYAYNSVGVADSVEKLSAGSRSLRSDNYVAGNYFGNQDQTNQKKDESKNLTPVS